MILPNIVNILTDSGIDKNEAIAEVKMLLNYYTNLTELDLICGKNIPQEKFDIIEAKAKLRAQTHQPIQYIIGQAHFMGEDYIVTPSVLIPRQETEILVKESIKIIEENNYTKILDMCCGSGCITCEVAKATNTQVLGIDISNEALKIAFSNMEKQNLFNKAVFRKSDLFTKIREDENFELIISNPPYIPPQMKNTIQEEVSFEPEIALYTKDKEGIEFYRKIIEQSKNFLTDFGHLIFELGQGQSLLVKEIFEEHNFKNIKITKDLAGIDRIISAQKN